MKYRFALIALALLQLHVQAGKLHRGDPIEVDNLLNEVPSSGPLQALPEEVSTEDAKVTSSELDDVDGIYNDAVKEANSGVTGETGVADDAMKTAGTAPSSEEDATDDAIVGLTAIRKSVIHRERQPELQMPKHKPEALNQIGTQKLEVAAAKPASIPVDLASMAIATDSLRHKHEKHKTAETRSTPLSVDNLASMATVTDSWDASMPEVPELKPEPDQLEDLTAMIKEDPAIKAPKPNEVVKTSSPEDALDRLAAMAMPSGASKASWPKAEPDRTKAGDVSEAARPTHATNTPNTDDLAFVEGTLSGKTDVTRQPSRGTRIHTANVDDLLSFARHLGDGKGPEAKANEEMKKKKSEKDNKKVEVGKVTKAEDVKKVSSKEKAEEGAAKTSKEVNNKNEKGDEKSDDKDDEKNDEVEEPVKKEGAKAGGKKDDKKETSKPDKKVDGRKNDKVETPAKKEEEKTDGKKDDKNDAGKPDTKVEANKNDKVEKPAKKEKDKTEEERHDKKESSKPNKKEDGKSDKVETPAKKEEEKTDSKKDDKKDASKPDTKVDEKKNDKAEKPVKKENDKTEEKSHAKKEASKPDKKADEKKDKVETPSKKEEAKTVGKKDDKKDASKPAEKMGDKTNKRAKDVKKEAKKAQTKKDDEQTDKEGKDDNKTPKKPQKKDDKETNEGEEDDEKEGKPDNKDGKKTDDEQEDDEWEAEKLEKKDATIKKDEEKGVTYSSWEEFLPTCRRELKNLVAKAEAEYAPPQLEGVLEAECDLDKMFPAVRDGFFDRRAECKAFAHNLARARAAERKGQRRAYDKCCKHWWDERMSSGGDGADSNPQQRTRLGVYICIAILVAGLIIATITHLQ